MDGKHHPENLPTILLLNTFAFTTSHTDILSNKYHALNPSLSSLPLLKFLTTQPSSPIRVLICSAGTPLTAQILNCLPSLELIITTSTGVEHIDWDCCKSRGILVANAGNVYTDDVADLAVGLLFDVLRRVSEGNRFVRNRLWLVQGDFSLGSKIGGKRVGIVGLGHIGSEVAKRLKAFGCIISYNSRTKKNTVPYPYYTNVRDLASDNDILIICCSLTAETHHIINKDVLSALGKDGIVVNVGRGSLIDEKELVRCLQQKEIGCAGLDVYENEPAVPTELLEMNNVVLSPHTAFFTSESLFDLHELIIANLEAFFLNKLLLTPVNYSEL